MRRAIENVQRERELYHEIVLQYLEVCLCSLDPYSATAYAPPRMRLAP